LNSGAPNHPASGPAAERPYVRWTGAVAIEAKILEKAWPFLIIIAAIPILVSDVTTPPASVIRALAVTRDLSLALTVILLVALGIRNVRRSGASLRTFAYPVAGVLLAVALLVAMTITHNLLASSLALLDENPKVNQLVEKILSDPASTASQRAFASERSAREAYLHHGVIRSHLTESGEEKEFEPNREDEDRRAQLLDAQAIVPVSLRSLENSTGLLSLLTLASVVVGCFSPIRSTSAT
jgi:hypothetical protein